MIIISLLSQGVLIGIEVLQIRGDIVVLGVIQAVEVHPIDLLDGFSRPDRSNFDSAGNNAEKDIAADRDEAQCAMHLRSTQRAEVAKIDAGQFGELDHAAGRASAIRGGSRGYGLEGGRGTIDEGDGVARRGVPEDQCVRLGDQRYGAVWVFA